MLLAERLTLSEWILLPNWQQFVQKALCCELCEVNVNKFVVCHIVVLLAVVFFVGQFDDANGCVRSSVHFAGGGQSVSTDDKSQLVSVWHSGQGPAEARRDSAAERRFSQVTAAH